MELVFNAIDESKLRDRVATIDDIDMARACVSAESVRETLYAECEDHDDDGLYWGEDIDGNSWTVRVEA